MILFSAVDQTHPVISDASENNFSMPYRRKRLSETRRSLPRRGTAISELQQLRCWDPAFAIIGSFDPSPRAAMAHRAHDFADSDSRSAIHTDRGIGRERRRASHHGQVLAGDTRLRFARRETDQQRADADR